MKLTTKRVDMKINKQPVDVRPIGNFMQIKQNLLQHHFHQVDVSGKMFDAYHVTRGPRKITTCHE